jgi:hypothetical protein
MAAGQLFIFFKGCETHHLLTILTDEICKKVNSFRERETTAVPAARHV